MTDDTEITNAQRARRCQQALATFNDPWDVRCNLIDFLTDARHWCDANREDYAELDRIAYQHYSADVVASPRSRT